MCALRVTMSFDPIRTPPFALGCMLTVLCRPGLAGPDKEQLCSGLGPAINTGSNESIRLSPQPTHKIKADGRYREGWGEGKWRAIKRHTAKMSFSLPNPEQVSSSLFPLFWLFQIGLLYNAVVIFLKRACCFPRSYCTVEFSAHFHYTLTQRSMYVTEA